MKRTAIQNCMLNRRKLHITCFKMQILTCFEFWRKSGVVRFLKSYNCFWLHFWCLLSLILLQNQTHGSHWEDWKTNILFTLTDLLKILERPSQIIIHLSLMILKVLIFLLGWTNCNASSSQIKSKKMLSGTWWQESKCYFCRCWQ